MKWTVLAVVGRPSPSVTDFFNSIKFHTECVEAETMDEALEIGDRLPPSVLSDGYELLNWYAFEGEVNGKATAGVRGDEQGEAAGDRQQGRKGGARKR